MNGLFSSREPLGIINTYSLHRIQLLYSAIIHSLYFVADTMGGTAFGRTSSSADKAFHVMASMGNVMQSYTCAQLLIEIQVRRLSLV